MADNGMLVFAGEHSKVLGRRICDHMGIELGKSETEFFPDGEIIVRLKEDVRGRDCYIVVSTCNPVNDNLMELLIYIDCLRRASARQIVAVIPYYGYGRQDRKDKGRVPITAKLVANQIVSAGAHRILAIDFHAAQIQGFFDIPVDHLSATPVFVDFFEERRDEWGDLCLVSPDIGNVKVAEGFANLLDADIAIIHKNRKSATSVEPRKLVGDVEGKTVLMMDDMISTAGTMRRATDFVMERGAKQVICGATHGLFVDGAESRLAAAEISHVAVTDTIPYTPPSSPEGSEHASDILCFADKMNVLSVAPLLGEAIIRIHDSRSVSELLNKGAGLKR